MPRAQLATCPRVDCAKEFDPLAFLATAVGYSLVTDSGMANCPVCRKSIDFRVRRHFIELGFTYWAGSLHFEGLATVRVTGLAIATEGETVAIRKGETLLIQVPAFKG